MISFQQAVSLRDIEDAYTEVAQGQALRLPHALRYGGAVGVPASLMQFVAKWSRGIESPALRLYGNVDSKSVEALTQEPHGLASVYFSESIEVSGGAPLTTREALSHAVPRIDAMQTSRFRDTMHGRGVFLGCFARAKNEYLLPFYSRPKHGALRSRDEFIQLTSRIISACAPSAEKLFKDNDAALDSIGTLLYELFKNTDEHATTDENGHAYSKNLRAVMAKFVQYDPESTGEHVVSSDPSLTKYLSENFSDRGQTNETSSSQGQQTPLLELTVVDTGPGLARRWLSRHGGKDDIELSIEREVDIVRECFALHATTKDTNASGGGLTYVLETLSHLNAYLRLRTGRVCLVQDFSESDSVEFAPSHWLADRKELPHTAGAAYSIVFPLSKVVR